MPVGADPVVVGRGPGNHVALSDERISRQHAMLWVQGGALHVRDLGSRNGVFVGGRRLDRFASSQVAPSEEVWLGEAARVTHRMSTGESGTLPRPFEPIGAGVPLTAIQQGVRLVVQLSGNRGPEAMLEAPMRGISIDIRSENRAVLLYLLGRALAGSLEDTRGQDDGWVADDELAIGIWGKGGLENATSRLNTLVSRTRKSFVDAGLPESVLEKDSGYTRLVVDEVRIA